MEVRQAGTREWYAVLDEDCPARSCFRPGPWTVRGATSSGTRNTGPGVARRRTAAMEAAVRSRARARRNRRANGNDFESAAEGAL